MTATTALKEGFSLKGNPYSDLFLSAGTKRNCLRATVENLRDRVKSSYKKSLRAASTWCYIPMFALTNRFGAFTLPLRNSDSTQGTS